MDLDRPFGQTRLEKVEEVVLGREGAGSSRDAGYQQRCQQRAGLDVEVRAS